MKMIKRLYAFSLILLFASLGASVGQAAITSHPLNPVAVSLTQKTVNGEVVSVDADKKEVVIKDSAGSEVKIVVSDSTKLTRAGKEVTLADIKAGEKVNVEADEAEGKLVAKSIAVTE
jgi:Cu/Ag efflux protein CusF